MTKPLHDLKKPIAQTGITLIELMIAVAVVAIIAAIAIPSYQNQITSSRRVEATTMALQMAQDMERCFTRFNTYNSNDCPVRNGTVRTSEQGWYQATVIATATTYRINAVPLGQQLTRDVGCGTFGYTSTGRREVTGTLPAERCW